MLKSIVAAVVAVVCVVLGAIAGHALKSPASAGASHDLAAATASSHGEPSGHGEKPAAKKDKSGHGGGDTAAPGQTEYFKFSREFVVPVMRQGRVSSLVILNINLEIDSRKSHDLFSIEPKLRDNIMTTLVALSNDGSKLEAITEVGNYETVRALILLNLGDVVSEGIENVLILDVARQDL